MMRHLLSPRDPHRDPGGTTGSTSEGGARNGWWLNLLAALPIAATALLLGMLLEGPSDKLSSFDKVAYPLVAGFLLLLTLALALRPRAVPEVVLTVIGGSSLFFLGKLLYLLFLAPAEVNITSEMTETFFWMPAVYVLSAFVPRVPGARRLAQGFYLAVLALSSVYAVPQLRAGLNYDVLYALLQLNLANLTLLALTHTFVTFIDQAVRARTQAETMSRLAYRDVLTGLPNRLCLEEEMGSALALARARGSMVAVLFVDVDGFKLVNDTLGHEMGDRLLVQLAERLKRFGRQDDILGRISGDEFVFVARDVRSAEEAVSLAQRLVDDASQSFHIDEQVLGVTVSVGISLYPDDGVHPSELLRHADSAMYQVKRSGKNGVRRFEAESDTGLESRKQLERDLRGALDNDELLLHYQPIFDLSSGELLKVEALLRWRHPRHGLVSPAQFIPLAESSGLILPIGAWALREACRQLGAWQRQGHSRLRMSVNVSALQFAQLTFVDGVAAALTEHHLHGGSLELELTESIVLQKPAAVQRALEQLHRLGVSIAIDDFGTGYSSLSYLRDLSIDALKIDRAFVKDLDTPRKAPQYSLALVQAIIGIAQTLDLVIVAEGVESEAQLNMLRGLGCHQGQGFHFARPLPPDQLELLLRRPDRQPVANDGVGGEVSSN